MNLSRQKQNLVLLGGDEDIYNFLGNVCRAVSNTADSIFTNPWANTLPEPPAIAILTIFL